MNDMYRTLIRWSFRFARQHKLVFLPQAVALAVLAAGLWLRVSVFPPAAVPNPFREEVYFFPVYACVVAVAIVAGVVVTGFVRAFYEGSDPSLAHGLDAARKRWKRICAWSAISAVYELARELIGPNHSLSYFALSFAWLMTTYFAIPILMEEEGDAWDTFFRSAALVRMTWRELLRSFFSFGWRMVACLCAFVFAGGLLWGKSDPAVQYYYLSGTFAAMVWIAPWTVFAYAQYQYAVHGRVPPGLDFGEQPLQEAA
jgi:hypothetical protein